ncbi:hypothetical protein D3Z17_03435 [Bacillus subtilis]|nr:hypothetical protein D3Z17_03435 [Bacillus subtilis]
MTISLLLFAQYQNFTTGQDEGGGENVFWWKNESFGMCLYSWKDWQKHGRNVLSLHIFWKFVFYIIF